MGNRIDDLEKSISELMIQVTSGNNSNLCISNVLKLLFYFVLKAGVDHATVPSSSSIKDEK